MSKWTRLKVIEIFIWLVIGFMIGLAGGLALGGYVVSQVLLDPYGSEQTIGP